VVSGHSLVHMRRVIFFKNQFLPTPNINGHVERAVAELTERDRLLRLLDE
jgi:hypothetical protein